MRTRLLYTLFFVFLAAPLFAQSSLSREPGYVDFAPITALFDVDPMIEVNLQGTLLRLGIATVEAAADDEETMAVAELLRDIKGVFVRGYRISDSSADRDRISDQMSAVARRLKQSGWQTVVRVREDGEDVHVHVRDTGKQLEGMMVMVMDPSEGQVIFVNLIGVIDPDRIAEIVRIGRRFSGEY